MISIESNSSSIIYFYSKDELYGEFSNFFRCDFYVNGKKWTTVEHFFQAAKFLGNHRYMEKIRMADSPKMARNLGQTRKFPIVENWDEIKEKVMFQGLFEKFSSHIELGNLLVKTGDKILVEASPYDYYWGCGSDGSGKNRLGYLLMELRHNLAERE